MRQEDGTCNGKSENPVPEHLKAMCSELGTMREDLREFRNRQVETQTAVLPVWRDQTHDAERASHLADRLERQLDLVDG